MSAWCVGVPRHPVMVCPWRCRRPSAPLLFVTIGSRGLPVRQRSLGSMPPTTSEKRHTDAASVVASPALRVHDPVGM
jgi:hypothetical protein